MQRSAVILFILVRPTVVLVYSVCVPCIVFTISQLLVLYKMNYEKEQEELNRLWQECLSDEDDNEPFEDSGDEFVPESSDDSSNDEPISKKLKFVKEPIPSTSRDTPDSVLDTINDVIERCMEEGSDEDNANEHCDNTNELTWEDVSGRNLKLFPFTEINVGVKEEIHAEYYDKGPYEFFKLFLTDELISMMVIETNRYATQCKASATLPKARIREWHDTNCEEMESFIGTLVWMGLCPFSSIEAYWSKCVVYTNKIKDIMSRNRFQLLLKSWHFHNNEILTEDRLQKITPLTNLLIKNFQNVVIPKEHVCIDETLVPFRGRLSFRQYISNKRHKFGIKLYKLCLEKGYTYNLQVYCGKDKVPNQSSSEKVVLSLSDNLLDKGRTIYTDNYYTSISLAHQLLKRNTHLVGTLRTNRKFNPKHITEKKLQKGDTIAAESNTGIVIQKWKDKRDVCTLSTKHTAEMKTVSHFGKDSQKPIVVTVYNKHKSYIDLSDQMKSYTTSLRRGVKWYRKLAVELIVGAAVVNAHILHQEVANEKMSITKFKEELALKLTKIDIRHDTTHHQQAEHVLEDVGTKSRRRCVVCYEKLSKTDRKLAQSKTPQSRYRCITCSKNYCLYCFFEVHKCTK